MIRRGFRTKRHGKRGNDRRPARMMDWLFIRSRCYPSSRILVYVEKERERGTEGERRTLFSQTEFLHEKKKFSSLQQLSIVCSNLLAIITKTLRLQVFCYCTYYIGFVVK